MNCNYCKGKCIKKGFYKTIQRYQCKACGRNQRRTYRNRKYTGWTDEQITVLNREGVGISSIGRILSIPKTSVQRRIKRVEKNKPKPVFTERGQVYEVDELYTYIGRKSNPCYIIYAINRRTTQVIVLCAGPGTGKI